MIREILYHQLRGFDLNPHALSLATLSLYLTAIEIDPEPEPEAKLTFPRPLMGEVLHNVSNDAKLAAKDLGSLTTNAASEMMGAFDIIIGNPPWTNLDNESGLDKAVYDIAERVVTSRLKNCNLENRPAMEDWLRSKVHAKVELAPDYRPDLAFLWRAMEWAKPNGVIAMAIAGRLLFKRTPNALAAREALFRTIRVTGIVNGADLRKDGVTWPNISAPFCLFFARNTVPSADTMFLYTSPYVETSIGKQGRLRLDSKRTQPISIKVLEERPTLFKTLFRGSGLDVNILEHIEKPYGKPLYKLYDYITKNHQMLMRQGFIVGKEDNIPPDDQRRSQNEELRKLDAYLLNNDKIDSTMLYYESLSKFNESYNSALQWPRKKELYLSPQVIIHNKLQNNGNRGVMLNITRKPIIFQERYTGIGSSGDKSKTDICIYIAAILYSDLVRYYALLISGQYGVERGIALIEDIKDFPIVPLEELPKEMKNNLGIIRKELLDTDNFELDVINDFVSKVYGLSLRDQEIIHDTLELHSTESAQKAAQLPPDRNSISLFSSRLLKQLAPLPKAWDARWIFKCDPLPQTEMTPATWQFLDIYSEQPPNIPNWSAKLFQKLADDEGVSQIIVSGLGWLRLGLLNQKRYWQPSLTTLVAHDIVREIDKDLSGWGLHP